MRKAGLLGCSGIKERVGVCSILALILIPGLGYGIASTYSQDNLANDSSSVEVYEITSAIPVPSKKPSPTIAITSAISKDSTYKVAMVIPFDAGAKNTNRFSSTQSDKRQAKIATEIFKLQEAGNFDKANAKLSRLKSRELRGHVLAERYLSTTGYVSSASELAQWLKYYSDYPQASRIYKLAIKKGARASALKSPQSRKAIIGNLASQNYKGKIYQSKKSRSQSQTQQYFDLKSKVRMAVQISEPTNALNLINAASASAIMDDVEYDRLRADVAAGYLYANRLSHALRLANASLKRSGDKVPQAAWVKGLVAWQQKDYKTSYRAFEKAASSDYSTGWMVSSASYWASRAAMRSGNKKHVRRLVKQAAQYKHSFYGVIANYALGEKDPYNWDVPKLKQKHFDALNKTDAGKRALLLLKSGREDLAQKELIYVNIRHKPVLKEALVAIAHEYDLADISMRLGNSMKSSDGKLYDAALYPDTSWKPQGGYKVDRALINAIIRQESRFKVGAKNPSGATGLMQLMPRTAEYILAKVNRDNKESIQNLHEPEVNLEFGQTYLHYLLNHREVGQDLFSLAMAYNAGPGNLSKWKKERDHIDDPLLFIETIPFHETRAFVDRVMANYWIYRIRFNQKTPSLNDVAQGRWARYVGQDSDIIDIALR